MSLLATIFDLVLPETCAGCGRPSELLCATCALPLQAAARRGPATPGVPRPYYVTHYERPVKAILAAYKEQGRTGLADPLGEALSTALRASFPAPSPDPRPPATPHPSRTTVVWVPSGRRALRRRRRDVLGEMAEVAVRRLRADGLAATAMDALRQRRRVADQAGLSAARRRANLRGAIEVRARAPVAGRRVVLVDDVVTTGASLAEAARALREAGAEVVGAATVAMTPRRRG